MPFTSKEKAFCVLEYARTQSPKTVQRPSSQSLQRRHQLQNKLGLGTKNFKKRAAYAHLNHQDGHQHQQRQWSRFVKPSCVVLGRVLEEQVWKLTFHKQQFGGTEERIAI